LYVPGVAQMGGPGRALLLWSFGAAMLAAFALDGWIKYESGKSTFSKSVIPAQAGIQNRGDSVPAGGLDSRLRGNDGMRSKSTFAFSAIILLAVTAELFWNGQSAHPTSPASSIYPKTALTDWLQKNVPENDRILFVTPKNSWLPGEVLQQNGRNHPSGVLPPNGAMVYGLHDVNGYDSLSPKAYRDFLVQGEGADVSPPLNGNMVLINNPRSKSLDALRVRYVVSKEPMVFAGSDRLGKTVFVGNDPLGKLNAVWQGEGCIIYRREINESVQYKDGKNFYPGWKNGVYQPTTFRLGLFISLCAWFAAITFKGVEFWRRENT